MGSMIHRELLGLAPVSDHNLLTYVYICICSLYAHRTTGVNWQSGLEVVLVAFLDEVVEQTKTTENLSAMEDRQSLFWGADSERVQGGMVQ